MGDNIAEGLTVDQGTPASAPGECYLLSASWLDRGGKLAGASAVGVFPSLEEAIKALLRSVADTIGRSRAIALMKANQLNTGHRVLEPGDLEEMAALVRQHRAAQAAQA